MTDPSVVMIGGSVTLHGGETLDTRQRIPSEPWDAIQRACCFRSELWWTEAMGVAELLLDDLGADAWALVWAQKSLYVPELDGTVKRRALRTHLGRKASADLMSDDFRGQGATINSDRTDLRWRILEHKFRYEDLRGRKPPALFVGGGHDFDDMGMESNTHAPFDELPRVMTAPILIVPDTPFIRAEIDEFLAWYRAGMPKIDPSVDYDEADPDSEPPSDDTKRASDIRPPVIQAEFHVTRWIDEGNERDPADLQAAVTFRRTRYDLDVGLFDLARDEGLRAALLTVEPSAQPEQSATPAPTEVTQNLDSLRSERAGIQETAREGEARVDADVWPIVQALNQGWTRVTTDDGHPADYQLAFGDKMPSIWGTDLHLVVMHLKTLKRSLRLQLRASALVTEHETEVQAFIADRAHKLADQFTIKPKPDQHVVANFRGYGWADDPEDRPEVIDLVGNIVRSMWDDLMALQASLETTHAQWMREEGPPEPLKPRTIEISIEIDPLEGTPRRSQQRHRVERSESRPTAPRRRSWISRLFGR